jgi:hypothetical protein
MWRHSRNLLLIAALCWVAPASAGSSASGDDGCPDANRRQIVILADQAPGDVPVYAGRRTLLP